MHDFAARLSYAERVALPARGAASGSAHVPFPRAAQPFSQSSRSCAPGKGPCAMRARTIRTGHNARPYTRRPSSTPSGAAFMSTASAADARCPVAFRWVIYLAKVFSSRSDSIWRYPCAQDSDARPLVVSRNFTEPNAYSIILPETRTYSSIPVWNVSRSNFTFSRPKGARLERVAFQNCTCGGKVALMQRTAGIPTYSRLLFHLTTQN
jgi:hypothetical protein